MICMSNSKAFVQSTSLEESFKLKLISYKIETCADSHEEVAVAVEDKARGHVVRGRPQPHLRVEG